MIDCVVSFLLVVDVYPPHVVTPLVWQVNVPINIALLGANSLASYAARKVHSVDCLVNP